MERAWATMAGTEPASPRPSAPRWAAPRAGAAPRDSASAASVSGPNYVLTTDLRLQLQDTIMPVSAQFLSAAAERPARTAPTLTATQSCLAAVKPQYVR